MMAMFSAIIVEICSFSDISVRTQGTFCRPAALAAISLLFPQTT